MHARSPLATRQVLSHEVLRARAGSALAARRGRGLSCWV